MQQSQKTDESFHSYPWWPWSSILVLAGLGLVMAFIGTYTFRWTWTGFYGNTLWDWLHLLIIPAALGLGTMWLTQRHQWHTTGTTLVWSVLLILAVLEIATYLFNWHWTGFKGNKLWDWMNLLLLPLVLTLVSIWFSAPRLWHSWWTTLIWLSLVVLALLILGSDVFGWTWTGFQGNTLWDWLSMLLVPVVLASAPIWFRVPFISRNRAAS